MIKLRENDAVRTHRDHNRKSKAQKELNFARDAENKNGFWRYRRCKASRVYVPPLINEKGELALRTMES